MERFKKYVNSDDELDLTDIPVAEIEAVTDKKFVLDISLAASFSNGWFTLEFDDPNIDDEVIDGFKLIDEFEDIIPLLVDPTVEFIDAGEDDSAWHIYSKTKPISAKEVLKIKDKYDSNQYFSDRIDRVYIIDLVES